MKPLKIGIGGVRGLVGQTFTPELAASFAQAFGTYLEGGRVLVSRDTRPSGPMVTAAVSAGLLAAGCEVVDLGVAPTPSLQLAVGWLDARGGIAVTAGHNPAGWNALKFVRGDGLYLSDRQAEELLDVYHQGEFAKAPWDRIHPAIARRDAIEHHLDALRTAFDVEAVRARGLRVAVDCANGACARLVPRWLDLLGCEVLAINDDVTAPFPHDPEPRPDTSAQAAALVRAGRADVGFVHDADGERLGLVDETGRALSEERTLTLAVAIRLAQRVGPVVTTVSTTGAIDTVAARHGAPVVRTPVGQANVSEAMIEHGAVVGGEGNGGVALPEIHATHDSAAAIGLIAEHLATSGRALSALVADLPALTMIKERVPVPPEAIYSALSEFREAVEDERGAVADATDGVKLAWPDGWVHVRASNTESLIRVIAEAATPERAAALVDWARERLGR